MMVNPSVSGGFDLEDDSGFYLGVWAANVEADDDDTVAGSGSIELDGYLGYSGFISMMMQDMTLDISLIHILIMIHGILKKLYLTFDFYGAYVTLCCWYRR